MYIHLAFCHSYLRAESSFSRLQVYRPCSFVTVETAFAFVGTEGTGGGYDLIILGSVDSEETFGSSKRRYRGNVGGQRKGLFWTC